MEGITVNLLGKQTCIGSSEMLHLFVQHCPGTPMA